MADFKPIYRKTLLFEGGFQQFPQDSANYCNGVLIGTNLGISAIAYKQYFGKCPTVQDMKNLTEETAMGIFKKNYWDKIAGDYINNQSVANLMFQYIIGSGASQISELKRMANLVAGKPIIVENDNPITKSEAEKINGIDQRKYHAELKSWRYKLYDSIVKRNPEKGIFLNGWRKRLDSYVYIPDMDAKKKDSNSDSSFS